MSEVVVVVGFVVVLVITNACFCFYWMGKIMKIKYTLIGWNCKTQGMVETFMMHEITELSSSVSIRGVLFLIMEIVSLLLSDEQNLKNSFS